MKKIYLTSLHLLHGGAEFVITQLANAFVEKNYDVIILCTYNLGKPAYRLDDRVKIRYLTSFKPNRKEFKSAVQSRNVFKVVREGFRAIRILAMKKLVLIKAFREIKEGIIISSRNEDSVLLSKFGRENVRKIAHIHHDLDENDVVGKSISGKYNHIDTIVLLTEELKNEVEDKMVPSDSLTRCISIENFIEPMVMSSEESKRQKSIITVGRLHEDKGFFRLIEIYHDLHEVHPDWKLQIIGDGELKEALVRQVEKLGISSSVEFLGFMDNEEARHKMQQASIFAMTSIHEGFGIVLVEAMDAGLPVISYDVRVGPRAIIEHDRSGYLITDNDKNEYVSKLKVLIENEKLRDEMSRNARKRAAFFYKDNIIRKWETLLEELSN